MNTAAIENFPAQGSGPSPGRRVILLPDDHFFVRRVPVDESPEAGGVAAQVELALEGFAPFPPSQLFHGYWTRPGTGQALVFAAYRKRFPAETLAEWAGADLVAPRFAVLLAAAAPTGATTWVAEGPTGLTVWHFDDDTGVPARIVTRAWTDETSAAARTAQREEVLRRAGETVTLVELDEIAVEAGAPGGGDFVFRAGSLTATLAVEDALMLDVRDPAELAAQRRARLRDRWLWRALVAAIVLMGVGLLTELTLTGLGAWQKGRLREIAVQTPVVNQVMTAQMLAVRIDELSSQRLRPFEMIAVADSQRPASIQFVRTVTRGRDTLVIDAQTAVQADIDAYRAALAALTGTRAAEVRDLSSRDGRTTFTLVVSFAPGALVNPGRPPEPTEEVES